MFPYFALHMQGRRQDLSLKGAEHGYSLLGGPTKLFSSKFLVKIRFKLKFRAVNPFHRGGQGTCWSPLAPPLSICRSTEMISTNW
jgi:hypothetical protein